MGKVVAIKERSTGNAAVGSMWFETKIFDDSTPVMDILKWESPHAGKLIITVPHETIPDRSDSAF